MIRARGDAVGALYRGMLDKNLVAKDISFAEMAMMAIYHTADPLTIRLPLHFMLMNRRGLGLALGLTPNALA